MNSRRLALLGFPAAALAACALAPAARAAGTLTVLANGDVDYIDPGQTYYTFGFMIASATQRTLYRAATGGALEPDLADGQPVIGNGGREVTVRIRSGVRFSPPVDREVTSADVKYALERAFFRTVNNGYAGAYLGAVDGARTNAAPGRRIKGILTPDDRTLVLRLRQPTAGGVRGALVLPFTAPVPREYALALDRRNPSSYGLRQVATGPFRMRTYRPGKTIELVRNPNWDPATDSRQVSLDRIVVDEGNPSSTAASRKIVGGTGMVNGDFLPEGGILTRIQAKFPDQLVFAPALGTRWVALNTRIRPLNNLNVRRAIVAGANREALAAARGQTPNVATHFLPPTVPGFEEAGGQAGPGYDFLANPRGNLELARAYLRKAGYRNGRARGTLLLVGANSGAGRRVAEETRRQLQALGFGVRSRYVTQDAVYTRFCNVPAARVAVCPNVGWFKDFDDGQTMLDPTFNGRNILRENNSNWSQLNVGAVNRLLNRGAVTLDQAERNRIFAQADRLITAQAPAIPYSWDLEPHIRSPDVRAEVDPFIGQWDIATATVGG